MIGGYRDNVSKGVEFYEEDCNNLERMQELLKGVDIVYHTACTAYEGLSVFSPKLIAENTYLNTVSMASAAIKNNVKRFVHCSSMARYGTQDVVPFTEKMICKPQDPYGISKFSAENVLRNLCDVHGMELVIAVPHNIIGPRQKYDDPFRNVASIMINLMLQGRQPIIYGDGEQKRCFSFVQDDIDCLNKLAFQDNVVGEIINIGPDEEFVTINHLAETIAKLLDIKFDGHEVGGTNPSLLEALGSTELNLLLDVGFNREVGEKASLYWTKDEGNLRKLIDKADGIAVGERAEFGRRAKERIRTAYSWQFIGEEYKRAWIFP